MQVIADCTLQGSLTSHGLDLDQELFAFLYGEGLLSSWLSSCAIYIAAGMTPRNQTVPLAEFDAPDRAPRSACPFCKIATAYPPFDPRAPPPSRSPIVQPSSTEPASFLVLSTPLLQAFLDILPLSRGHILLCPRRHAPKLTDVTQAEARELGYYLPILSAALVRAAGSPDWNVVQNNGAAAAQVVPHMHFHIIPRPELRDTPGERFTATMFGRGQRCELDEDDAAVLAGKIREEVANILREGVRASARHKL
jgi:diadenosine tetraphosphate (Ap4A) HIT family hydrolase